jgi:4-alpha-glucanotransferase
MSPLALAQSDFAFFRLLLERSLAHAGMLRIDHAMGLERQFWIPRGRPASEGAYVSFPRDALLGVVAGASRRHGAVIVAEDLGTVPEGFDGALARFGLLSSRVLLFERDASGFRPAKDWPERALATANTHDLPTLEGWRLGRDLEIRRALGILRSDRALAAARAERAAEVRALCDRLRSDGVLDALEPTPATLRAGVHAFLARTPCALVGISLDDVAGEVEPANVPGVSPLRFPSWTRRMSRPLAALARKLPEALATGPSPSAAG